MACRCPIPGINSTHPMHPSAAAQPIGSSTGALTGKKRKRPYDSDSDESTDTGTDTNSNSASEAVDPPPLASNVAQSSASQSPPAAIEGLLDVDFVRGNCANPDPQGTCPVQSASAMPVRTQPRRCPARSRDCQSSADCKTQAVGVFARCTSCQAKQVNSKWQSACMVATPLKRDEFRPPCVCNSTYISRQCCSVSDGIVYEPPHARLGELSEL